MTLSIDSAVAHIHRQSGHTVEPLRAFDTISNAAWLVRFNGVDAVLRTHSLSFGQPVTNHERELVIHQLAVDHRLSPEILFADPAEGLLITRYESAGAFDPDVIVSRIGLESVGAALAKLHRIAVPSVLTGYTLREAADCYWQRAGQPTDATLRACVQQVYDNEPETDIASQVLCHRDVLHSNILHTDPVQFIDWEFASPGDRWFDLAAMICWHELNARQRDILLVAYYGKPLPPREHQALARAIVCFRALCTLWSLPAVT
ncbi:MAG: phosphotransferase [Pseudomonadota bacterium]